MSLVGTRPILQDELRQYELHHRARIAIKPGITGMWQVSGRSDITDFEEVVRLDTEYISKRMPFHQLDISEGKSDIGKEQLIDQELFNPQSSYVSSSRIIYTPSTFARTSLLHLQEVGSLQAVHPHISQRSDLVSFLCFVVLSGEGQTYQLSEGD